MLLDAFLEIVLKVADNTLIYDQVNHPKVNSARSNLSQTWWTNLLVLSVANFTLLSVLYWRVTLGASQEGFYFSQWRQEVRLTLPTYVFSSWTFSSSLNILNPVVGFSLRLMLEVRFLGICLSMEKGKVGNLLEFTSKGLEVVLLSAS